MCSCEVQRPLGTCGVLKHPWGVLKFHARGLLRSSEALLTVTPGGVCELQYVQWLLPHLDTFPNVAPMEYKIYRS
jgi:hypothetical protein